MALCSELVPIMVLRVVRFEMLYACNFQFIAMFVGHLNRNPRYGATPKVIVAVIVGYFMGKFSYQQKCAEKLMQLPNSPVGEMLRQRRKGMYRERC